MLYSLIPTLNSLYRLDRLDGMLEIILWSVSGLRFDLEIPVKDFRINNGLKKITEHTVFHIK